jgi:hypothetical protein
MFCFSLQAIFLRHDDEFGESSVAKIWLNYFVNDSHFGYTTKFLKETLLLAL